MNAIETKSKLETYFQQFRKDIIGINQSFVSPFGEKNIVYTDWTASGRLYRPIEEKLMNTFGPFVANTHTETSITGTAMTMAYHEARHIIKHHVNATDNDVLITDGTGMTGVVNKLQRILGLRIPENLKEYTTIPNEIKNVVNNENLIVETSSRNNKLIVYKYILGIPSLNNTKKKAK